VRPSPSAPASGLVAGGEYAGQFYGGWLTEYSLSVDNLFVFIMVRFALPRPFQRAGSCDRDQQVGWHVGPFQGDDVAGVRDLSELGVWKLSPVGLPI